MGCYLYALIHSYGRLIIGIRLAPVKFMKGLVTDRLCTRPHIWLRLNLVRSCLVTFSHVSVTVLNEHILIGKKF